MRMRQYIISIPSRKANRWFSTGFFANVHLIYNSNNTCKRDYNICDVIDLLAVILLLMEW